ncbi:MAG TPA: SMI1/KNR4 family protein [Planctomycetota bacterium]|nr:SMI1/KNR4 family protein [Planctomycetota bacterium]
MKTSERKLLRKMIESITIPPRKDENNPISKKCFRPAELKEIVKAERTLGFTLPNAVRDIFLKVGNGGFGPEYGIVGIKGGAKLDGCTLETCYAKMRKLEKENAVWRWPERLLPLANYGCGMWACVDCEYQRLPMILWDPNNLSAELEGNEARLNWGNSFWDQGRSLRAWLIDWLDQRSSPEPKWPSESWLKKRLGFALPRIKM